LDDGSREASKRDRSAARIRTRSLGSTRKVHSSRNEPVDPAFIVFAVASQAATSRDLPGHLDAISAL
jgi:hypothetical protein